jgi:hypothetical protein
MENTQQQPPTQQPPAAPTATPAASELTLIAQELDQVLKGLQAPSTTVPAVSAQEQDQKGREKEEAEENEEDAEKAFADMNVEAILAKAAEAGNILRANEIFTDLVDTIRDAWQATREKGATAEQVEKLIKAQEPMLKAMGAIVKALDEITTAIKSVPATSPLGKAIGVERLAGAAGASAAQDSKEQPIPKPQLLKALQKSIINEGELRLLKAGAFGSFTKEKLDEIRKA